uniref:EF-hand domain-containing protein n=1 Tax=Gouania willdenowi TaxID=441366 RepID=A0A8C5G7B9_GOUWI
MSELGTAMILLIKTFERFASEDGDKDKLSKEEAKKLLLTELPVDEILNVLDDNKDSQIDLEEFLRLVCALTCACHKSLQQCVGLIM